MIAAAVLAIAQATAPQETFVTRVADDARVIDRVAEASRRDLPRDLLRRIASEDLELLRGRRADGTYQHATYERMEADRTEDSYSIQPRATDDEKPSYTEIKGSFVYRLILAVPSRRMVVTRNRRVFIERVDIEYLTQGSNTAKFQTERLELWLEPGKNKVVDLKEIVRQATIRVHAHADKEAGYGNLVLTMVHAKVIDDPGSPYAEAVSSLKAILRALDHGDIPSIRAMAARIQTGLRPSASSVGTPPSGSTLNVTAPATPAASSEFYSELQTIEDLLTGNELEKREGLDRLHQLIRKLRPR